MRSPLPPSPTRCRSTRFAFRAGLALAAWLTGCAGRAEPARPAPDGPAAASATSKPSASATPTASASAPEDPSKLKVAAHRIDTNCLKKADPQLAYVNAMVEGSAIHTGEIDRLTLPDVTASRLAAWRKSREKLTLPPGRTFVEAWTVLEPEKKGGAPRVGRVALCVFEGPPVLEGSDFVVARSEPDAESLGGIKLVMEISEPAAVKLKKISADAPALFVVRDGEGLCDVSSVFLAREKKGSVAIHQKALEPGFGLPKP